MSPVHTFVMLVLFVVQTKTTGYYNDGGCDRIVRLRLNQSFEVTAFPPYPQQMTNIYSFSSLYRGPRECTWIFEARDCQLEFLQRLSAFQRGDVDCDEQYFLIGDENREERFCGFRKPPSRLNSTGTRLFMTHFARNRRHGLNYGHGLETIASRLRGEVRCSALVAPPRVCTPTRRFCSQVPAKECLDPGKCTMSMSIFADPAGNVTSFKVCNSAAGHACQSTGQMCFQTVPLNSAVPQFPPVPPITGVPSCSESIQVTCPEPGSCTPKFKWLLVSQSGNTPNAGNLTCVAGPECTCVFQGNACYTPQ